MSDDAELDRLMARRLAEMRQRVRKRQDALPAGDTPAGDPRQTLVSFLGYRGVEVLENAERQFPAQTAALIPKLAEVISRGELTQKIDGGQLLYVFRIAGLHVRMDTRISVAEDGKTVSLADKLRGKGKS